MKLLLLLCAITFGATDFSSVETVETDIEITITLTDGTTQSTLVTQEELLSNKDFFADISEAEIVRCTTQSADGSDDCRTSAATCAESRAGYAACKCEGGQQSACNYVDDNP